MNLIYLLAVPSAKRFHRQSNRQPARSRGHYCFISLAAVRIRLAPLCSVLWPKKATFCWRVRPLLLPVFNSIYQVYLYQHHHIWYGPGLYVHTTYNLFFGSNVTRFVRPRRQLSCETCRISHNLWICMVCGHIGCGRYTEEHANRHFSLSHHTYRYAAHGPRRDKCGRVPQRKV